VQWSEAMEAVESRMNHYYIVESQSFRYS
jgi:hypothetical protein